jgi:hypothetical protein
MPLPARPSRRQLLTGASGLALAVVVATACGSTEPLPSATRVPASDGPGAATSGTSDPLAAFEARLRDATAREGQLVRAIADASDAGAPEIRLAVGQMRDWVEAERAWLAEHPVEPCFDAAGTKFEAALDAMAAAADGFEGLVEVSVPPSDDVTRPSMGAAAAQALQDAARALEDAAGLAKVARTECR